jgi:hypothetical protein
MRLLTFWTFYIVLFFFQIMIWRLPFHHPQVKSLLSWTKSTEIVSFPDTRSRSHVTTDGQSVSQHVKVSSPLWDLWPDITFCPKFVFRKLLSCLCGAPSLTRGRVCHLSFSVCSNLPVFTSSIYVTCVLQFSNLYTSFIQSPLSTADYALLVIIGPNYRSSLDTWTVV